MHTDGDGIANLEQLGAEVAALGYHANVRTLAGRLPYLDVRNSHASVPTEKVYAQGGSFWWSWAERIAGCDQISTAAAILARVLRTADGK
ncbi:MAG TPA: hypothetical protein VGM53_17975 [Streptosporangiaceae bacterium]|jgi:hypothetical protein